MLFKKNDLALLQKHGHGLIEVFRAMSSFWQILLIGGLNCLVTAFVVRSIFYAVCMVTGFAAGAVTAAIRYYIDNRKLKLSYIGLWLLLLSQLYCLVTTFVSLVTGFAACAVTAVIRYYSDYLKLKVT